MRTGTDEIRFPALPSQGNGFLLPGRTGREGEMKKTAGRLALPLLISAAAGILMLFPELAPDLEMRMESPADWTLLYRCFTAHFVHFTAAHWFFDAVMFLLLGRQVCREEKREFLPLILVSSFSVSLCVWIFCRELDSYRGLSGIDCALFGWLAMRSLPRKRGIVLLLLAGFCLKTVWECATGTALFAGGEGFEAVPEAHLAGLLCGMALCGKEGAERKRKSGGSGKERRGAGMESADGAEVSLPRFRLRFQRIAGGSFGEGRSPRRFF